MGEFFQPGRRKIGIITLVVACALMVGWLRSPGTQDTFTIDFGSSIQCKLVSISGQIIIAKLSTDMQRPIRTVPWTAQKASNGGWVTVVKLPDGAQVNWEHLLSNDLYSTGTDQMGANFANFSVEWLQRPYWFAVIPLSLLTAYLLILELPPVKQAAPPVTTAN